MQMASVQLDKSILCALQEPSLHRNNPEQIIHRETYTSHLLFAGDLVYKIKKPVRLPPVDFSTLKKRRSSLEKEFLLNQRLAPAVYLGLLPLVQEGGQWCFGNSAPPAEYALVMRHLPARRMLSSLLDCHQANTEMIQAIAGMLAPFHAQANFTQRIAPHHYPGALHEVLEKHLNQIRPLVGQLLDRECFEVIRQFASCFIKEHSDSLVRRLVQRRIREVHGDLRCDHVCYTPAGIQIFGSKKPIPSWGYQDTAWDVASLILDLDLRRANRHAMAFFKAYLELSHDEQLPLLLPFYKSYCALVRGKDEWFLSAGSSSEAPRYFDYACSAARQPWAETRWDPG
jgi:uncharacterized protein